MTVPTLRYVNGNGKSKCVLLGYVRTIGMDCGLAWLTVYSRPLQYIRMYVHTVYV